MAKIQTVRKINTVGKKDIFSDLGRIFFSIDWFTNIKSTQMFDIIHKINDWKWIEISFDILLIEKWDNKIS